MSEEALDLKVCGKTASALRFLSFVFAMVACGVCSAQTARVARLSNGYRCTRGTDVLSVSAVATNILRVDVRPGGVQDARTVVLDPALRERAAHGLRLGAVRSGGRLRTDAFDVTVDCSAQSLHVADAAGTALLSVSGLWDNAARQSVSMHRFADDPLYGMTGTELNKPVTSVERPDGAVVRAGAQGNGGAPFFFTKTFGVLVDSVDGLFTTTGADIAFDQDSRREVEFFVMVGAPMQVMSGLADLTGHAPMPPRWTLGFLNSQWGSDEAELKSIVAEYRTKQIPLDGFILDFDWKAWGEDNYGEWRWNSTSGPGSVAPNKFPDGASGALGKDILAQGVHLAGILKPRILLYKTGTTEFMDAAAYADAHGFWYPNGGVQKDYFSHRESKNLDFSSPEARAWYWKHLEPAFDAGMTAWWSDEADEGALANGKNGLLSSTEFLNMGRALYDGQRGYSKTRVWSINRNFYLGAQRYGYAEWSGDIKSGEASMQLQPMRMLAALNLGEPHWSMDTGGFSGHPTDAEYARWMEFAAFVPIFRVHGTHNEKRQPWVYGPVAEAAAKKAMELRYSLLPYIYSAEWSCSKTGVGVVRPMQWVFPDDAEAAKQTDEWMFGDALLVAPVLHVHADEREMYLPAGTWFAYDSGKAFAGGATVKVAVDKKTMADIPLFVRAGSIVATDTPGQDTDAMRPTEITLDVFPSYKREAVWTMYDDDGASYDYEKGASFMQAIRARVSDGEIVTEFAAPRGTFATSVKSYRVRVHGAAGAGAVRGASVGKDRFGDVVEFVVPAGKARRVVLPLPTVSVR